MAFYLSSVGVFFIIEALWARILRSKYVKSTDTLPLISVPRSCSPLWRGICNIRPILLSAMGWVLGDGKDASFWQDQWVPGEGKLSMKAISEVYATKATKKVAEYVTGSGSGDWGALQSALPLSTCLKIADIVPSTRLRSARF